MKFETTVGVADNRHQYKTRSPGVARQNRPKLGRCVSSNNSMVIALFSTRELRFYRCSIFDLLVFVLGPRVQIMTRSIAAAI